MFVLILTLSWYQSQGVAASVTTQEFTNRERCMKAATVYIKQHPNQYAKAICVNK